MFRGLGVWGLGVWGLGFFLTSGLGLGVPGVGLAWTLWSPPFLHGVMSCICLVDVFMGTLLSWTLGVGRPIAGGGFSTSWGAGGVV